MTAAGTMTFRWLRAPDRKLLGNAVGAQCFGLLTEQVVSGGTLLLYLNALQLNGASILFVLALGPFLMALLNVPLAFAADRLGLKRCGQLGNAGMMTGMALIILGPSVSPHPLPWIISGLLLHTVGSVFFSTGWFALLAQVVPEQYTGRFFAVLRCAWQFVGILFFGAMALFFTAATPLYVYQLFLALCTAGLLVRSLFYRAIPEASRTVERLPFATAVRATMRVPGYLPYLAYVFLLVACTAKGPDMLRLLARQRLGFGDNLVVLLSVSGMMGSLLGFSAGGRSVDRWGTRSVFAVCHLGLAAVLALFPLRAFVPGGASMLAMLVAFLLGVVQAALSIAFTAETFAICSTRYRVLAIGIISSMQTMAAAVAGFLSASVLSAGVLRAHWLFCGVALTDYDTILLGLAVMVGLLVITLGLVPSIAQERTVQVAGEGVAEILPAARPRRTSGTAGGNGRILSFACLLLLGGLAGGCASVPVHRSFEPVPGFDTTPRLAIISAFEPELQKLKKATQVTEVRVHNGRTYYLGRLEGQDVVLLLSGFSMVNAAMNTQSLLDHYAVREIVFSGIAGGVNPGLHVGDVTVPAAWGEYQEQVFARETTNGWDAGRFGGEFPNYGMMFPHGVSVTRRDSPADQLERRFWFAADAGGLEIARHLAGGVKLSQQTGDGAALAVEPQIVVGGKGVSGPTFVDNAAYREWAWQTFHADALDMETAAVAHVAYVNEVPFIAFRALSDLAGGGGSKNESAVFFKLAANNSATVVMAYVRAYGERHGVPPASQKAVHLQP